MHIISFGLNVAFAGIVYRAVWSFIAPSPKTSELDVVIVYAVATVANNFRDRLVFKPTAG